MEIAMQHFFPPFSFSSFLCPFFFGVLFSERVRAPSPANQIGGGGRMRGRGIAGPISSYRCRRCWTHSMRFFGHIRYEGKTNIKKKKNANRCRDVGHIYIGQKGGGGVDFWRTFWQALWHIDWTLPASRWSPPFSDFSRIFLVSCPWRVPFN